MKVAFLSSYTINYIVKIVEKEFKNNDIEVYITPFNQYMQEVLIENSHLYIFNPDIIMIAIDGETQLQNQQEFFELLKVTSQKFSTSSIFVHNCVCFEPSILHFLNCNSLESKTYKAAQLNIELINIASKFSNIYILDLIHVLTIYGSERLFDHRFWYLAKTFWSSLGNQKVADQIINAIKILYEKRKKCLILDLDNTLWGGILGDVGIENIKLSNDGEGKAFYDFQKKILELYNSGIILAICSKNEETLAINTINTHPYMIIREKHFAAIKINWKDKASNIKEIAEELNLGLDSFVFFDDSEFERNLVKQILPEVEVPELPGDFSDYPFFISQLNYFDTFNITSEDKVRSKLYAEEKIRSQEKKTAISFESYLNSLNIKVEINDLQKCDITRAAQLTQRTNQFNFSTKRFTESEITEYLANNNNQILSLFSSDKIGDSGFVGLAFLKRNNNCVFIDNFLMSCRVLGRGIEEYFLAYIAQEAKANNKFNIKTEFVKTSKNMPALNFLLKSGFKQIDAYCFKIETNQAIKLFPEWVKKRLS